MARTFSRCDATPAPFRFVTDSPLKNAIDGVTGYMADRPFCAQTARFLCVQETDLPRHPTPIGRRRSSVASVEVGSVIVMTTLPMARPSLTQRRASTTPLNG